MKKPFSVILQALGMEKPLSSTKQRLLRIYQNFHGNYFVDQLWTITSNDNDSTAKAE